MSQKQIEMSAHLQVLVSHAISNAARFTPNGGARQNEENKIRKASDELTKIIKEHKTI